MPEGFIFAGKYTKKGDLEIKECKALAKEEDQQNTDFQDVN
jgi:hypothetical protein